MSAWLWSICVFAAFGFVGDVAHMVLDTPDNVILGARRSFQSVLLFSRCERKEVRRACDLITKGKKPIFIKDILVVDATPNIKFEFFSTHFDRFRALNNDGAARHFLFWPEGGGSRWRYINTTRKSELFGQFSGKEFVVEPNGGLIGSGITNVNKGQIDDYLNIAPWDVGEGADWALSLNKSTLQDGLQIGLPLQDVSLSFQNGGLSHVNTNSENTDSNKKPVCDVSLPENPIPCLLALIIGGYFFGRHAYRKETRKWRDD